MVNSGTLAVMIENLIGVYTPTMSEAGQWAVDFNYITRAVILILAIWSVTMMVGIMLKTIGGRK